MTLAGLRWGRSTQDRQVHAFPAPVATGAVVARCGHTVLADTVESTPGPEQTLCLSCAVLIAEQITDRGNEPGFSWFPTPEPGRSSPLPVPGGRPEAGSYPWDPRGDRRGR